MTESSCFIGAFSVKDFIQKTVSYRVDGENIVASLFLPSHRSTQKLPCIVLGHGWGMTAGGDLQDYAKAFVARGFAALAFDYRNLGRSEGLPRQHLDPWKQIADFRASISYARGLAEIDPERIGIWGSSYGGGHVLSVTALDPRVACAVSQVPTISGWRAARSRMSDEAWKTQWATFIADREATFVGAEMAKILTTSIDPNAQAAYKDVDSYQYMHEQGKICPEWENYTTLASLELARGYEPGSYLYHIVDVPLAALDLKHRHQNLQLNYVVMRK